jgi:hypothetical protein
MAETENGQENILTRVMFLAMKLMIWWVSWIQYVVFRPFVLLYSVLCFMMDVIKRLVDLSVDLSISFCSICIKQRVTFDESDKEATRIIKEEAVLEYSSENMRDERLLQQLYDIYFWGQDREPPKNLLTSEWESIGFQTSNPRVDFRGGGVISIQHLINFEKHYHHVREEMRELADEQRWMLAVISIRVTAFMTGYFDFRADCPFESWKQLSLGTKRKFKNLANFLRRFQDDDTTVFSRVRECEAYSMLQNTLLLCLYREWKTKCTKFPEYTLINIGETEKEVQRQFKKAMEKRVYGSFFDFQAELGFKETKKPLLSQPTGFSLFD